MGWYTDAKNWGKRHGAKMVREAAVVGAGVAGSFTPLGPLGGAAAAYAVDEWFGDPIERNTERVINKAGTEADDFIDYLRGEGQKTTRPPDLPTTVEGNADVTVLSGEAEEPSYTLPIAITAGAVATVGLTLLVLHRTGRLPWRR